MLNLTDLVQVREFRKEDINFILDSSIQCLSKYTESIVKGMARQESINHLEKIVLHILNRKNVNTFICTLSEDPNYIVGYIVGDPSINHIYLQYTKYSYRKLGIQRNFLLPLCLEGSSEKVTVNFPTKEMIKLQKLDRISIINKLIEQLIESDAHISI